MIFHQIVLRGYGGLVITLRFGGIAVMSLFVEELPAQFTGIFYDLFVLDLLHLGQLYRSF